MNDPRPQLAAAAAAFQQGRLSDAEQACRTLLSSRPDLADARHLLGLVLAESGQVDAALKALNEALAGKPRDRALRLNLLRLLARLGRWGDLLAAVDPGDASLDARSLQARALVESGDPDRALPVLAALLDQAADDVALHTLMARVRELRREDDAALEHADRALAHPDPPFAAALVRARVLIRQGQADAARSLLEDLTEKTENPVNRSLAAGELARLLDREGRWDEAFAHAEAANRALLGTEAVRQARETSVYSRQSIEEMTRFFTPERLAGWMPPPRHDHPTPVFLVGFPRSGTTLMDRILDAHPSVAVLEERPTLHDALARFAQGEAGWHALEGMNDEELAPFRERYRERVGRELEGRTAELVVDKLPLNIVFMGLIARLFPGARIILALRDPRDVCLSCFLQSFAVNDAMSNFLALESTADYYRRVMTLGMTLLDTLPVRQFRLRYEDLVADTAGRARALLQFLGLEWDEGVLRFFEHARGRGIDTPSYGQVTRPVYTDALARWRHYRRPLAPVLPMLEPFVERFGYAATES